MSLMYHHVLSTQQVWECMDAETVSPRLPSLTVQPGDPPSQSGYGVMPQGRGMWLKKMFLEVKIFIKVAKMNSHHRIGSYVR